MGSLSKSWALVLLATINPPVRGVDRQPSDDYLVTKHIVVPSPLVEVGYLFTLNADNFMENFHCSPGPLSDKMLFLREKIAVFAPRQSVLLFLNSCGLLF